MSELEFELNEDEKSYSVYGKGDFFWHWEYEGIPYDICIPDTYKGLPVTEIGSDTFDDCDSLERITLPKGLTTICDKAFLGCSSLKSIILPKSLTEIGCQAFEYCSSLKNITLPESLTEMGDEVFCNCKFLKSIEVDENNPCYKSIDGNLYTKDGKVLIAYAIGKTQTEISDTLGISQAQVSRLEKNAIENVKKLIL